MKLYTQKKMIKNILQLQKELSDCFVKVIIVKLLIVFKFIIQLSQIIKKLSKKKFKIQFVLL